MTAFDEFSAIPSGRYGLIMADPPWLFLNWSKKGERKNASAQYPCAASGEIACLDLPRIAAPDCILWLWATNPMLRQAYALLDKWGFEDKTGGHWSKLSKNSVLGEAGAKQHFGTGYILRGACEPYLIATRGKPKYESKRVRSCIIAPVREHSRKPDEAYANAAELAGDVPKIEIFSRQRRDGWDAFGDEIDRFAGDHRSPAELTAESAA